MKYIMAIRKVRLAPQVYDKIREMLSEGKDNKEIFNILKVNVPGIRRSQIYTQAHQFKKQDKSDVSSLTASVNTSFEKTEPIILDSNAKTEPVEEGWMEIPNMPRPAQERNEDRPRMGSNDTIEVPVAVRPSMPRQAGRVSKGYAPSIKPVQSVASPIESAIMKWELQGFTITTTRGDTINIELSPESLKDIVNHLLR